VLTRFDESYAAIQLPMANLAIGDGGSDAQREGLVVRPSQ